MEEEQNQESTKTQVTKEFIKILKDFYVDIKKTTMKVVKEIFLKLKKHFFLRILW